MTATVRNWLAAPRHPSTLNSKGSPLSLRQYSATVGVPYPTIKKYTAANAQKRAKLGATVGPSITHLGKDDVKLIERCVVRHDRANDPKDISSCIDMVQDLNPNLSRRQAGDQWRRRIWRKVRL